MSADLTSTARLDRRLPEVAVAAWNARYPIGTPVAAYPGVRPEDDTPSWPCERLATRTRSEAHVLGGHTAVVWVDGHGACIALTHIDPSPQAVAAAWRANTPAPDPAGVQAEYRHLLCDADPDSTVPAFPYLIKSQPKGATT